MVKENNQPYFIGIDIGTGSTKAIAIDSKGTIIANSQLYLFYPKHYIRDILNKILKSVWKAFIEM